MQKTNFKIKKNHKSGSFLNGGVDDTRFKVFEKYLLHLFAPKIDTICRLINKLAL